MPRVKLFVNDIKRQLLKAEVSREGNRAIDQAKIQVPPETPVCASDKIVYVQDMVELCTNRLIFNFCQHIKDESGYNHNPIGSNDFPTSLSHWDFQNTNVDDGTLRNLASELPLDCMCDPTPSVYAVGKVRCSGVVDRAILFACCRYLTISNECDYDLRQDQRWSMSAWLYPTANCPTAMVMGKRVGIDATDAGYSLNLDTCARVSFEIANGTCEWSVTSGACTVPLCMWTNVTVTYDGQSNQNGMKMYINGELDNTGSSCTITAPVVNCAFFSIGATACTTDHYCGRLDGTYFFEKDLTSCSVKALFNEGSIQYICGLWDGKAVEFDGCKGHVTLKDKAPGCPRPSAIKLHMKFECDITDETELNTPVMGNGVETFVDSIVDDFAFCFNACRYVSIPSNPALNFISTEKFSWSVWARIDACAPTSVLFGKKTDRTACTAGWDFRIVTTACVPNIGWEMSNTCTQFELEPCCSPCVFDAQWHHFAGTYSGNTQDVRSMKLYIDGLDQNITNPTCITGSFTNCVVMTVGASGDGTNDFAGDMVCLRVWKGKEITAKEIKHIHDATFGAAVRGEYEIVTWLKTPTASMCSRTVFHKSSSSTTGIEMTINNCAVCGPGFTCSGFTASGFTTTSGTAACSVFFRHNTTTLTGTTDITDCCWHQVRVRRDGCNLISLYVDNVLQDCGTDCSCAICEVDAEFGRDNAMCEHYDGAISSFRLYSGTLSEVDICSLFSKRNPRSNIKFGGATNRVEKLIGSKKITTQSFGKELGEVEVRAQQFCNRTPEFILKTLLKDNTCLDTHFHGVDSGITLRSYQADGKVVDIADDLSQLTGKVYHTDGLRQFHLHCASFNLTTASFCYQKNMQNIESGEDDAEIVNCLLVIGENKRFTTSCNFTGDCVQTVFDLSQSPVTARVEHPVGTELCPEECYDINTATKQLTFTTAPDMCGCCCNILIEYEFELPLNIRGKNQASIDEIGIKAKRLILPWITTRNDGVRFITAYLEQFKEVNFRAQACIPGLANGIGENDVITINNTIKNIGGSFLIKSLTWKYPEGVTVLQLGEFNFQMLEFAKQITQKIHDLESAVVRVKDLRDFESPQECLGLTITANINSTGEFIEDLGIADAVCVTEIFDAIYDGCCTTYDGDDAYA